MGAIKAAKKFTDGGTKPGMVGLVSSYNKEKKKAMSGGGLPSKAVAKKSLVGSQTLD